jgi:hypothetical protein
MMKIGILNLSWANDNYGAILQAVGLERTLKNLGYEAETINIFYKTNINDLFSGNGIKRILRKMIFKSNINNAHSLAQFRNKNMNLTKKVFFDSNEFYKHKFDFDACVVGSDQVWKDVFVNSEWVQVYFLDFLRSDINKIAYAASFGKDTWTAGADTTQYVKNCLQKFNAVSVRELGGVKICNEVFGIKAQTAVDPSLLVGRDFWESVIDRNGSIDHDHDVVFFLIHKKKRKVFMRLIEMIKKKSGKRVKELSKHNLLGRFFEPVPVWLRKIKDAEFVITDSLHGVCFSIVFEKQFIAYMQNEDETLTRIVSLLDQLGISDRLISNVDEKNVDDLLKKKIDYSRVNILLEKMREDSMDFLKKALDRRDKQ